jgi:hypothetical protein
MKKSNISHQCVKVCIIFSLLIFFPAVIVTAQAMTGDPDNSGSIDIVDALLVAQYYVGLDLETFHQEAGDVNCSNSIDILDALLIAQYYVGLVSEFQECDPTPAPTPVSLGDEYIELIKRWAKEQDIDLTGYNIQHIDNEAAEYILPGYTFFIIYLIQFPIAMAEPDEQLGTHSIVAIDEEAGVYHIPDEDHLQTFYLQHQVVILTAEERILGIKAWLGLSQEFKNDGYYTFNISDDDITMEQLFGDYVEWRVTGISRVISGGEGLITADAILGIDGMLAIVNEEYELIAGVRPICQSSKLLDSDPVVRKMAEQDLLAMGYSAEQYLISRRATASPEIKEAIDRIWERIIEQEKRRERILQLLSRNRTE